MLAVKGTQPGLHDSIVVFSTPPVPTIFARWYTPITRRPNSGTAVLKRAAAGRVRNGAENFSTLRHFALNVRKQHAPKLSDRKKRIRAGFSDAFREQLLASTVI